ncbi:hypothetical protein [Paraburkholderia sp. J67]|uniref:hypothetical protein n=1 Tax=Paraburkholderia sp. J67 TaxID=2805435 RepID=UPI002ABE843C|nr:hypothetical protein [Paraburkholderia sp. J67]
MKKLITGTTVFALLFVAGMAHADEGSVGLGSALGPLILIVLVGWLLSVAAVYFVFRSIRRGWGLPATVIYLFSPALFFAAHSLWADAFGSKNDMTTETAARPVVIAGATFPAGSEIDYLQAGFGRWSRTPVFARSERPVKWGAVEIRELQIDGYAAHTVNVTLTHDQTVATRWTCTDDERSTHFDVASQPPQLLGCSLAASLTLGGMRWPAGSTLRNQANDWVLYWEARSNGGGGDTTVASFGFPLFRMKAHYGPALDLKSWSGETLGETSEDLDMGGYRFPKSSMELITRMADGALRVEGPSTDLKTGLTRQCVMMRGKSVAPCTEAEVNQARDEPNPFF